MLITADLTTETQIEGFLITGGHANDAGSISYSSKGFFSDYGAGMYNRNSSPSIINTVFSGNTANFLGGGMINLSSSPSIVNSVFKGNITTSRGGGMFNSNSSSPSIVNTVFSGNLASFDGGGMYNAGSSPSIINSTFSGNHALTGGGIDNATSSSSTIYNSVFYGNGVDIANEATSSITGASNFSEDYDGNRFHSLNSRPLL